MFMLYYIFIALPTGDEFAAAAVEVHEIDERCQCR